MKPQAAFLDEAASVLVSNKNLVLRAPTGAGKSTLLPAHLLEHTRQDSKILLVQPRQVAARAVAARIAQLHGTTLGGVVGYHVRFDRKASHNTRLLVVTSGIALQYIQHDPTLEGWSMVLVDEFHERSMELDLLIAFLRESQQALRPDLRIGVLSATLDHARIQEYLDAMPVTAVTRRHSLTIHYLKTAVPVPWSSRTWTTPWVDLLKRALLEQESDILAFFPGVGEINSVSSAIDEHCRHHHIDVLHLYGAMSSHEQDRVFQPAQRRRLILATNVAETSLTVPNIHTVVDFGWVRRARVHPGLLMNRILLERVSQASADQRAGRAGRLGPGVVYRAWSDADQRRLDVHESPDVERVDSANAMMEILRWQGRDVDRFDWFQEPPPAMFQSALHTLCTLQLICDDTITSLGRAVAQLPVHPRLGKMLALGKNTPILHDLCLVAALLTETRFPYGMPLGQLGEESDVAHILSMLKAGRDVPQAQRVKKVAALLHNTIEELPDAAHNEPPPSSIAEALLYAFPDRIAQRRSPQSTDFLLRTGVGARLSSDSTVVHSPYLIALDLAAHPRDNLRILAAIGLTPEQLPASAISQEDVYRFSEEQERVEARRIKRLDALILEETPLLQEDPDKIRAVLMDAVKKDPSRHYSNDHKAVQWLERYAWAHRYFPREYPALGEHFWEQVWMVVCATARRFSDISKAPFVDHFRMAVGYGIAQRLDEDVPTHMIVPSGRRIALVFDEHGVVLSVRIQEMFGAVDTPRILRGRLPVTLHLLAPNSRPQQVTEDLAGFWAHTYPQIRKELRARYAKHAWPEDPLRAEPTSRAKRRT